MATIAPQAHRPEPSPRLAAAVQEFIDALLDEVRPEPDRPTRLLTVEQALEAMGGISRSTLYGIIAAGRLRTVTIGRRRLVPESALADFTASAEEGPRHGGVDASTAST
jgi:excisionase family DNA binding protein